MELVSMVAVCRERRARVYSDVYCLVFQGSTLLRIRPRVTSMFMGLEGAMAVQSTRTGPATLASG